MSKRNLTDRTLKALKPAKPGRLYDVMDTTVPGFGVRVSEAGRRTFILVSRYPGSRNPTRRALGQYGALTLEKARAKARDWIEMIRKGIDPASAEETAKLEELRRQENTFAGVAEEFIVHVHRQKQRKAKVVEREIRDEFISRWAARPITSITSHDVVAVIDATVDRGASYQAHNLLGHIRRLFNWTIARGVYGLDRSPCDRLKPKDLIGKRALRTRILTDEELRGFWRATGRLEYPWGSLFRLLAVTIQRKSEVANALRSELNLPDKLWVIPAERMKMDAADVVPLSPMAVEIFKSLPEFKNGDHLFSTTFGTKPVQGFSKAKARLDRLMLEELQKMAVERGADPDKVKLAPWVIHDVRRTGRTALSALPVPEMVRELVIAHTKPGLHKVYDQYAYLDEKRQALELWAARLRSIVEPPPANVVELAKARA
jgi:integrase